MYLVVKLFLQHNIHGYIYTDTHTDTHICTCVHMHRQTHRYVYTHTQYTYKHLYKGLVHPVIGKYWSFSLESISSVVAGQIFFVKMFGKHGGLGAILKVVMPFVWNDHFKSTFALNSH